MEGKYMKDDLYYACFIYSHVHRKRLKRKCTKMLIMAIYELRIHM